MSRSHSFAISAIDLTEVAEKYDHLIDTFCSVNLDPTSVLNCICLSDLCQDSNFLSSLQINTDDVTECSNLYYTDDRVCAFIGGGSLGDITTTGTLKGPATFTIDPSEYNCNTGTVIIAGNLQVDGTTTTINSTELTVEDLNIVLATGSTNCTTSDGAGISVCLGTDGLATLTYDSTNDRWAMNKSLATDLTGSVTGQVSDVSNHFTCDIAECGDLYYTDSRARLSVCGICDLGYDNTTGTFCVVTYKTADFNNDFASKCTCDLTEFGNLYYTDARADARVCCVLETLTFEQVTDIDFTTNSPQTTANLNLQSIGNGCYCFQAPTTTTSLCDLTDNIDFTDSCTTGYVLTSDGDGTFSFQETDTFGAIIYSLALG